MAVRGVLHTTFSLLTLGNDLAQAYLINPVITAINIYQTPGNDRMKGCPGVIYF